MTETSDTHAHRGRPRDPHADRAALTATQELLGEVGYDRLTIEGVARRAGVAKTTIYRRWPSKRELVAAAIHDARGIPPMPDTGSLAGDLEVLVVAMARNLSDPAILQITAELLSSLARGDDLFDEYWNGYVVPMRTAFAEVFERAQRRGEIRVDVDVDRLIDVFAGTNLYQAIRPSAQPLDERLREAVNLLWQGLSPPGGSPPTGP